MSANSHQPLVSVLCRSMNRPELVAALTSVSRQTYSNIEIILIDASGQGLTQHNDLALDLPLEVVTAGQPLNRPAAANLALQKANGEYLLFLDEDDWIDTRHIGQLVDTLQHNPEIGVVYSSTQRTSASGINTEETLRTPYNAGRLRRDNFIPIHSAMFKNSLVKSGACFDETLDVFEDWDFWLQLSEQTDFLHVDELTAFYRMGGESNTTSDDPQTRYQAGHPIAEARERVFSKWLTKWSAHDLNQMLESLDEGTLIQSLHNDIKRLNHDITQLNNEVRTLNHTTKKLNQNISRKNAELQETKAHIEHLTQYIDMLQGSMSWRVTRPLRWLRRKIDGWRAARPASDLPKQKPLDGAAGSPETASPVQGNLDIPNANQNEFPEQVTLQGWCCSPNGIDRIEALVDGEVVSRFSTGISRPDIAELLPDYPEAFSSGFHQDLALPEIAAGEHTLELRFIDKNQQQRTVTRQFFLYKNSDLYNTWYWRNMPDDAEQALLGAATKTDPSKSRANINLLITDADNKTDLWATLSSLADQVWPRWTLHIQGSPSQSVEDFVNSTFGADRRIHWHSNLPDALTDLEKEAAWTAVLQAGETLAPHALAEFMQLARLQDLHLIYSDHDEVNESGDHLNPVFTPQWSPEHLMSNNYIGGFFAFNNLHKINWRDLSLESKSWRYAILLQIADAVSNSPDPVRRVAKVLWSAKEGSVTSTQQAEESDALRAHLSRTNAGASIQEQEHGIRAVLWPLTRTPKVSIVIPTMGKLDLIKPCIDSLLEITAYPDFEVVMLDNSRGKFPEGIQYLRDRQLKVIECNEPFNWARLNNIGVRNSSGELLLFLNDDIEITSADWLEQLVRQALRTQVGAVGALLYYPNGALQHTGVLLVNYGGGGIHLLHKRMPGSKIYRQLHQTTREVSANTGACLMVSREKFEEINGFDEELAIVGNDVDLCLRLLDKGYRNIWTPLCHLIHHESISRKTSVPKADEKAMWQRWSKRFIAGDEYYNPNLSADKGDFSLQVNNLRTRSSLPDSSASAQVTERLLPGVNLIGYTRADMGIGEGARSDARALDAANEPFGIICFTSGNPSTMNDLSWQYKEVDTSPYDVTLLHINPDHALQAISELPSSHFDGRYSIGYWAWELPEIPPDWEKAFKHFDEIWVPSNFVQDAVSMKSPVPVVRIPHSIEVKTDSSLTRADFDLPQEPFLFLVMFDTYSRQERKNPYGALEAFRNAFAADDMSVRLVIKVNNATPDALRTIQEKAGSHRNVLLLDQVYSRAQVNAIIANCDCFVSLHRSEGFGFGPAEAMALGKAIIATNWSGNIDYMRPDNSIGINYELVTIEQDYGPYKKGQKWAEPDLDQASQAMEKLANDRAWAERLGNNARKTIEEEFSPMAVGIMMRNRLAAIRQRQAEEA